MFFFVCAGEGEAFPEPSAEHMLEFTLKVKCQRKPKAPKNSEDPRELYLHSQGELCVCVCGGGSPNGDDIIVDFPPVSSGDMKWVPIGDQSVKVKFERVGCVKSHPASPSVWLADVKPVHEDILIAKMRPGQVCR